MAFLEELGKTISDKSKEVVGKAKELTGVLQLKAQVSTEKSKVTEGYAAIGKAYFKVHKDETEGEFAAEFAAITAGLAKISSLETEISKLEGNRICAECGSKVDRESEYCSKCGAAMEKRTETEPAVKSVYPNTEEIKDAAITEIRETEIQKEKKEDEFVPSEEY